MKPLRGALWLLMMAMTVSFWIPAARADSFEYTFSGVNSGRVGGDGLAVTLQFITTGLVTPFTDVFASQLVSCTNCLISTTIPAAEFYPSDLGCSGCASIGFVD